MGRTGMADLPLHGGHCPPWLFDRMKRLAGALLEAIVLEFGPVEVLRRLSDPVWFQALGSLLGFDWHSSGLTTTVCGAIKEAVQERGDGLGFFVAGGKGKRSLQTPREILEAGERYGLPQETSQLAEVSRLVAKIDSAGLQDGFDLYHHTFFFTADGRWAVIQQGLQDATGWARRYHWLDEGAGDFVSDPHGAVVGRRQGMVLNLVAAEGKEHQVALLALAQERSERVVQTYRSLLESLEKGRAPEGVQRYLKLPGTHAIPQAKTLEKSFLALYDRRFSHYREIFQVPGVGPQGFRALSMVAEVLYGVPASFRDPVRYAFAHGGKDGHPFPVRRDVYDHSTAFLEEAIRKARLGQTEKMELLKRLAALHGGS